MNYQTITYEVEDNIAKIYMNRPKELNSLSQQMMLDLIDAFTRASNSTDVRTVLFSGHGRAFCAGGDVKEFSQISSEEGFAKYMSDANKAVTSIISCKKPVVVAAGGAAVGAGASLTLAGDVIYVGDDLTFMLAFGQVGLVPDMSGNYMLPRAVGHAKAKELVFTCRPVKADEAKEIGIANYVVPRADLEAEALKMAKKIAKGPIGAFGMAKEMINKSYECSLNEILQDEQTAQTIAWKSADGKEGMLAFAEKRKPDFQGK